MLNPENHLRMKHNMNIKTATDAEYMAEAGISLTGCSKGNGVFRRQQAFILTGAI
jgi:hypothetical protein